MFAAPGRVDVTMSEFRVRLSPAANRSEHAAIELLLANINARTSRCQVTLGIARFTSDSTFNDRSQRNSGAQASISPARTRNADPN